MKKQDIKELVYKIYEESQEDEDYEPINKDNKNEPPVVGGIYFTVLNRKKVFYIIIRQVGQYYECLKMSNFYEFATHYDVFYYTDLNQLYIIETDINFYLSSEEVQNSILLETADQRFVKSLTKFRNMSDTEKIEQQELKNGFYYPFGNRYVELFKQKELDTVKDYHLRIFQILDEMEEEELNIVKFPPERSVEYRLYLVASTEKNTSNGENFILYKEQDYEIIDIIVPKEYIGKKIKITHKGEVIFDKVINDNVIALSFEDAKSIDLDKLVKDIKVEVIE
jgi:hypothetical protein